MALEGGDWLCRENLTNLIGTSNALMCMGNSTKITITNSTSDQEPLPLKDHNPGARASGVERQGLEMPKSKTNQIE